MATIFRGKAITAVAVLSTTVAINAQPIQNRLLLQPPPQSLKDYPNPAPPKPLPFVQDVQRQSQLLREATVPRLFDFPLPMPPPNRAAIADAILNRNVNLPLPVGVPFTVDDFYLPSPVPTQPFRVWHHRPQLGPIILPPFREGSWPNPVSAPRSVALELVRANALLSPVIVAGTPFNQDDWAAPASVPKKPQEFLFYYIQDQTKPGFINYDWPLAPKRPSLVADPITNRLVLPVVITTTPFHQHDWPLAATVRVAKVWDPYNRNVFLPVPVGVPTHQLDWPLPQRARLVPGTHTLNDLGVLSLPVGVPRRPVEWPTPQAILLTVRWELEGRSAIYMPRFEAEWAVNSNQVVGPRQVQPVTH